ncbi:MAG TPA: AEC family transporter, partial [Myxococcota bacterium]|nr:AEC family transporter [Myxococcota bacterium]
MGSLLLVAFCVPLGVLLRRDLQTATLNHWALHVALPAITLLSMHRVQKLEPALVASVWVVLVGGVVWSLILGKLLGWDRQTIGAVALCAAFSNTSFVGFPLLEAYVGQEALPHAAQVDQLGSFFLVSTVGQGIASVAAGGSTSPRKLLLAMAKFPAVYASILGLLSRDWPMPAPLEELLARLGSTLSPVALVAVGTTLQLPKVGILRELALGLGYKLVLTSCCCCPPCLSSAAFLL